MTNDQYVGVVWRGFTPPSRRSRAGKEEVPPPMTRSNLDRWEDCGEAERGAILDRIAAQCDGLASRIRAGVAGIRLKVEELRSRISRPLEYLMRREQPRQQSLNDVLRDAQRAADACSSVRASTTDCPTVARTMGGRGGKRKKRGGSKPSPFRQRCRPAYLRVL